MCYAPLALVPSLASPVVGVEGCYCDDPPWIDRDSDGDWDDPWDDPWYDYTEQMRDAWHADNWHRFMSPEENEQEATFAFCFPDHATHVEEIQAEQINRSEYRPNRKPHTPNVKRDRGFIRKLHGENRAMKAVYRRVTIKALRAEDKQEARAA